MNRTISDKESSTEPAESSEAESAFRRWSRRKHEARTAAREVATPEPAPVPKVGVSDPSAERVLTDADMPAIDTLDEGSDYSPFMSPGVSEALRRAALRRLFGSPRFNQLCELEGEFFDAHGFEPLGNVVTHEMRAALERELEKAKSTVKERVSGELTDSEKSDAAVSLESPERVQSDSKTAGAGPEDGESDKQGDA